MKDHLIIGTINAVTYKETFKRIMAGDTVLGYHKGSMDFIVPSHYRGTYVKDGVKYGTLPNGCWFTSLKTTKPALKVSKSWDPNTDKYDNYEAYNFNKLKDIPKDVPENTCIGVPVTIVWYLDSDGYIKVEEE